MNCKKRFTSREKVDLGYLTVIKKNAKREPFSREKIIMSIVKSFGKRPLPEEKVKGATDTIVDNIHKLGKKEIKTTTIGEMVLQELSKLDKVAYIRFASVFMNFKTLDELQKDLRKLERTWNNDNRS